MPHHTPITQAQVNKAAYALLTAGTTPTVRAIRDQLGRGSMSTIHKYLNNWHAHQQQIASLCTHIPAGQFNICHELRTRLKEVLSTQEARATVAQRMSHLLNTEISVHQLNFWTATSRKEWRFPLEYLPALEQACNTRQISTWLATLHGDHYLTDGDTIAYQIAQLERQQKETAAQLHQLRQLAAISHRSSSPKATHPQPDLPTDTIDPDILMSVTTYYGNWCAQHPHIQFTGSQQAQLIASLYKITQETGTLNTTSLDALMSVAQ